MNQTLLFADADQELCYLYRLYFSRLNYQVETASDGLDCLEKLRHLHPDTLILELELPWGGGEGVLGYMAETDGLRSVPVVLVSSAVPSDHLSKERNALVYYSLLKPFHLDDLLHYIRATAGVRFAMDDAICDELCLGGKS